MARLVWGCLSTLYAVLLTPPPLWGADYWLGSPGPPNGATVTTCSSSNPLPWMISQVQPMSGTLNEWVWVNRDRAVVWWANQTRPTVLGGLYGPAVLWPGHASYASMAYGISQRAGPVVVVGASSISSQSAGGFLRAFWQRVNPPASGDPPEQAKVEPMFNLNDAHLCWLPVGWLLVTAEDVNACDHIVGTGTWNGVAQPYLLTPQTVVGQ